MELKKAIDHASIINGEILVAKLDRLSRDLNMITGLQKNIAFAVCDMPTSDSLMIQIYGAFAQREREMISQRTKAALAIKKQWYKDNEIELKAAGKKFRLGNVFKEKSFIEEGQKLAVESIKENADNFAIKLKPIIKDFQAKGMGVRRIANELNMMQIKTARGKNWMPTSVQNLIDRLQNLS